MTFRPIGALASEIVGRLELGSGPTCREEQISPLETLYGGGKPERNVNEKVRGQAPAVGGRGGKGGETGRCSPASTNPAFLRLVSSNCEPTLSPRKRVPARGVGSHLVLVHCRVAPETVACAAMTALRH